MRTYTSTNSEQEANDAGLGRGGKWTNHFLAKGVTPVYGKVIEGNNANGTKSYQTT
jgi:hypothetical protein